MDHYIAVSKLTCVVMLILAIIAASFITKIESAWIFVIAMSSGIGLVLILRWFWWRVNAWT